MIYGNDRVLRFIAAKNLPGYDSFITADFTKSFEHEEPLEILFPPGDNGSYEFPIGTEGEGGLTTIVGNFLSETNRTEHMEDSLLHFKKDFKYPYQSEISFRANPASTSPLSIFNFDFIQEGSYIRGVNSGAYRFYAGPFKGYTKELENLCIFSTSMNDLDASDCDGFSQRLGSFYEPSYSPSIHDVFRYVGEPRMKVDPVNPFNPTFMSGNPFESLFYNWLNIWNRQNRPIPYNMTPEGTDYCVLISPRHAILLAEKVFPRSLCFYSNTEGFVTPTVEAEVSTFKEIWDAIGFVNENRDAETLAVFNEMAKHFEGIKILTFAEELPSDIQSPMLHDPNQSDSVFHAMMFGQEGRGHVCTICPPLKKDEIDTCKIKFDPSGKCSEILQLLNEKDCGCLSNTKTNVFFPLPSTKRISGSFGLEAGDRASPVITYKNNTPVLLGFVSNYDIADGNSIGVVKILGMGSTKQYTFPWGSSFAPIDILNRYIKLAN